LRGSGAAQGTSLLRKSSEEAAGVPMRLIVRVGDAHSKSEHEAVVASCGRLIDRLIQVVGRGMVALAQPVFSRLLLGRTGHIPKLKSQRRNPVSNEIVLVASDEKVALRLRIPK